MHWIIMPMRSWLKFVMMTVGEEEEELARDLILAGCVGGRGSLGRGK